MAYEKPTLVTVGTAIDAIQDPVNKLSIDSDGLPSDPAYSADE